MEEKSDEFPKGLETDISEVEVLSNLLDNTSISSPNENAQCSELHTTEITKSNSEEDDRGSIVSNASKMESNNEPAGAAAVINIQSTALGGDSSVDIGEARHTGIDNNAESITCRNVSVTNVPEKIVFCVDICEDPGCPPFRLSDGSKYHILFMVRKVVDLFMTIKGQINGNHEFALVMLLPDRAVWIRDFTKIHRDIASDIDSLDEGIPSEIFDLSTVFDVLKDQIDVPKAGGPTYSLRIIFIYNRSHCIPTFLSGRESFEYFVNSDYFTFDAIYIHEEPTEMNKCEEIFHALCDLDVKGWSYIYNVPRNATQLHNNMAKLIAHPFQRPLQKSAFYKVPEGGLQGFFTK